MEEVKEFNYDFFVSHTKSEATACARYLKLLLTQYNSNLKIFYDSDDLIDLNQLNQYITNTNKIIILLTKKYFKSFWCFFEFMVFTKLEKDIICFMFPDDKNYLVNWIANLTDIKLKKIYDRFTPYQKRYIRQLDIDNYEHFFKKMCTLIKNLNKIEIKKITDSLNIFRKTVLTEMKDHIKLTDSITEKEIKGEEPSCDLTQDGSPNIILVGHLDHEIVSIAKIIRYFLKQKEKKACLFFKETDTIKLSRCNSVVIVLLYDDCLEKIEFAKNLLSLHKESTKDNIKIIFQGILVDHKFKFIETEEIEDIVEKLSLSEDDKQTLIEIYIMLIKQYISIPFDSYQSLNILNVQFLLIVKRLISFLPDCYENMLGKKRNTEEQKETLTLRRSGTM
jgi:hypothetical protein